MAELLISKGVDVNATDVNATTPLHFATISGKFDIVQLLLENGAEVDSKTVGGSYPDESPLHAATFAGHTQIAELLLDRGANIKSATELGYASLRRSVD